MQLYWWIVPPQSADIESSLSVYRRSFDVERRFFFGLSLFIAEYLRKAAGRKFEKKGNELAISFYENLWKKSGSLDKSSKKLWKHSKKLKKSFSILIKILINQHL